MEKRNKLRGMIAASAIAEGVKLFLLANIDAFTDEQIDSLIDSF